MNLLPIVPVLITALIAFAVYKYQNRIGYSILTIMKSVDKDSEHIKIKPDWGWLIAERVSFNNYGFRNLENVELHISMRTQPIFVEVTKLSSLSKKSVSHVWKEGVLSLTLANFPSGEKLDVEYLRIGEPTGLLGRVKGTGGKYKIVRTEDHEIKRQGVTAGILVGLSVLAWGISFLDSGALQPPKPNATPTRATEAVAIPSTKG